MTVKELVADLLYCNADSNVVLEDDVEFTDEHGKVSGTCYQIEKVVRHGRSVSLHFDNRQHFMREQEPCKDCISRETARRIVDSGRTRQQMIDMILATPPVTPQSKTGHWINRSWDDVTDENVECSACGKWRWGKTNYCPNCGTEMESEE